MKNQKNRFEFHKQFAGPADYYKSFLVLRRLNEEIKLSEFYYDAQNFEDLAGFCDRYSLEFSGVDIKKRHRSGGEAVSEKEIGNLLKEKLRISSDGKVFAYDIIDNNHGLAPRFICAHDDAAPAGCRNISEPDFRKTMAEAGIEYDWAPVFKESPSGKRFNDPMDIWEKTLHIAGDNLDLSVALLSACRRTIFRDTDIDFIRRPEGIAGNSWVLTNNDILEYEKEPYFFNPVIRITHASLFEVPGFGPGKLSKIKEFEVPVDSFMVFCQLQEMDERVPAGICMNCLTEGKITCGDWVTCWECNHDILIFYDDLFPFTIEMKAEMRRYAKMLWEGTKKEIK